MLMRLYTESDLLAAQCLLDGAWEHLSPAELAAVCAAVVYESRGQDDDSPPALPNRAVREAVERLGTLWAELHELETRHGLDVARRPDAGIADATYRWAGGANLLQVLTHADITAGDFVRWIRQVIDLLGQIAQAVEPASPLRQTARTAADLVSRGVVSYSSTV
jgi:ATP-dependent RNA helicase HelY